MIPEALVGSQLAPQQFGSYMAVGTKFYTRGEAIFFELKPGFASEHFPMRLLEERCQPHPDGAPKRSVYLSTYRVLERVPIDQLGNLYLTTDDGRVLELERGEYREEPGRQLHLYQEYCPATPRVASRLAPHEFASAITDPGRPVGFPRVMFADMILHELAGDPLEGDIGDLPYRELTHLRLCLNGLLEDDEKTSKNVSRRLFGRVHYRTVRSGFFVGDADDFAYYPLPGRDQLESEHRNWWRSAQTVSD